MKKIALLIALLFCASPVAAQTQRVVSTPAATVSTVLQSAATANGNGTVWDASGYSVAVLMVNCASCSGGTLVNFEGSPDNSNFDSLVGNRVGNTTTLSAGTQTAGVTLWQVPLFGMRYVRARVSGYSAGTVTVTAYASMTVPQLTNTSVTVGNTITTNVDAIDGLPFPSFSFSIAGSDGTNSRNLRTTTNGTLKVDLSGTAGNATAIKVDGSAVTQPVSAASLPLPTGAATAAKQPALGTAGTSSADVLTVQGRASMTPLLVDGSATTQPVSAASLPLPSGAATAAKQPALGTAGTSSADVITVQGRASMTPLLVDGSGVTQPVSASSLPLPTGAATSANQSTEITALQLIDNLPNTIGSTTSGQSGALAMGATTTAAPTYTTAQTNPLSLTTGGLLRVDGSGVTQPVSASSLPLPTGASTSAKQPALGTAGSASSDVITVQGIASMTALKVDGSAVTQPVSGSVTVTQGTGTNLHIVCDSGCSGSAGFADNAAFTFGTTAVNPIAGVFDDTSSNTATENSAAIARITANKALHVNFRNASGTEIGTSSNPIQVTLANTGSNATAVKVDGSAVTQPVSGTVSITANSTVDNNKWNGQAVASPDANSYVISPEAATATAAAAASACNILSAASTNATNCKASAGNLYGYELYNTSTTVYYLRLYNLSASPTCSSATGFIRTIPIPPAAAAGGVGGAVSNYAVPVNFGTGIGYCITGGSGSTDNTNAATGVFGEIRYK